MSNTTGINSQLLNTSVAIITTALVVYILIIGKSILLPLFTAIVIWYLVIRLIAAFSTIPFTQIALPKSIALILAIMVTGLVVYGFAELVTRSISGIILDAPKYQAKVSELLSYISQLTDSRFDYKELFKNINLTSIFSNAALTLTYITGNLAIIVIYVCFLLFEYKTFHNKIKLMCKNEKQGKATNEIIDRIVSDINTYMKVKTWISIATSLSSYLILMAFHIDHAGFWALLIFLLNFIPTVGSIIAVTLTLIAISIQFTSLAAFIVLASLLIAVQMIFGNVIEPKFMGRNLNLSPLVILLALSFWGSIWGVLGMFFCVPLMTILNIILARFENTRGLAILLSSSPREI